MWIFEYTNYRRNDLDPVESEISSTVWEKVIDSIRIDTLWTLRDLRDEPESWTLYANQIPMFDSKILREAFYNRGRPDLKVAQFSFFPAVQALVGEVRSHLPAVEKIEDFQPSGHLMALTHWPTGWWEDRERGVEAVQWTRKLALGNLRLSSDSEQGEIVVANLSSVSKEAIHRLDDLTMETAYRRHYSDLQEVRDIPTDDLPPLERIAVFIAYRHTCFETACRLYQIVQDYGNRTMFTPYMDHHDMKIGDFRNQLRERIDESDIFLPLVSEDYAEPGTVGAMELEHAKHVASVRSLEDFFAPVFVGQPRGELSRYDGLVVSSAQEITTDRVSRYLGRIFRSVLGRHQTS